MVFWNLNDLTITIFVSLLLLLWLILLWLYKRERLQAIFLFISFSFVVINIFEIKWDYKKNVSVDWWNIVFVLDVSKSMDAVDMIDTDKSVSRIEWSKNLITSYISKYTNNLYGLIIFAWEALETLPFTNDLWAFNTILHWVGNSNISKNWTNLNSVFESLSDYFEDYKEGWVAVIFTDWWDEAIDLSKDLVKDLKNSKVSLLLVWVGDVKWAKIPLWKDFFWEEVFKVYKWKEVITRLNEKNLKDIWEKYKIDYITLNNTKKFDEINDFISNNIELISLERSINNREDLTPKFIFIAFLFFIFSLFTWNIAWRKNK